MLLLLSGAAAFVPSTMRAPRVAEMPHIASGICACANAAPPAMDIAKEQLLSTLNAGEGLLLDGAAAESVEEYVLDLSSRNPTEEPARSNLLNGKWEVIYAGSPGAGFLDSPTRPLALALYAPISPSVVAQGLSRLPFADASLGSLVVTITSPEAGQPRVSVETSVAVFGNTQPLMLRANLSPRSAVALREDFLEAEAFGQRSLLPGPLAVSRTLFVAYLDDDLLIVRDDTGKPSVLRRALKFPMSVEYPSDESAPGAS